MQPHPLRSLLALVASLAVVLTACNRSTPPQQTDGADENQVIPVAAEPAQVGSLRATIHLSAVVVPADGAEFLAVAPEPARVIEITRNEGEPVTAGDLLVRFELPSATQELARQQADVAIAQARLENVRATRDRVADFVERGLVPRNDLSQADRDLAEAQTTVAAAANAFKRAQDSLARASVRAPFSGIVVNRLHNPGDVALGTSGDPVLRIVDPARLEVLAAIPGADASRVLPGASARVAGAVDGKTITLSVVGRPGGMPDAEGKLHVRLTFTSPTSLTVDAPVELDIDGEERQRVVFVPLTTLVGAGADAALFVAVGDIAQRRTVTTGVTTDLGVEITSGLKAGELVITRGQASVVDGTRISVETLR